MWTSIRKTKLASNLTQFVVVVLLSPLGLMFLGVPHQESDHPPKFKSRPTLKNSVGLEAISVGINLKTFQCSGTVFSSQTIMVNFPARKAASMKAPL